MCCENQGDFRGCFCEVEIIQECDQVEKVTQGPADKQISAGESEKSSHGECGQGH